MEYLKADIKFPTNTIDKAVIQEHGVFRNDQSIWTIQFPLYPQHACSQWQVLPHDINDFIINYYRNRLNIQPNSFLGKTTADFYFSFFPASLVDNCDASSNNCVPIEYSGPGVRASRLVSPWPVSVSATLVNNGKEIGIQSGTSSGRFLP